MKVPVKDMPIIMIFLVLPVTFMTIGQGLGMDGEIWRTDSLDLGLVSLASLSEILKRP